MVAELPVLSRHFRVITFDNRGVGRSKSLTYSYTTEAMADDAASVLDSAGIASASLYGISLGGMVAQQLALRHPRRVESLVLGATHPGGPRAVSPEAEVLDFFRRRPELPPEEAAWASVPRCKLRARAVASTRRESPRMWSSGSRIHSQPTPIERSSVPLGSTTVLAACLAYRFRR